MEDIASAAKQVEISPSWMELRVVVSTLRGVGSSRLFEIVCAEGFSDSTAPELDDIDSSEFFRIIITLDCLSAPKLGFRFLSMALPLWTAK